MSPVRISTSRDPSAGPPNRKREVQRGNLEDFICEGISKPNRAGHSIEFQLVRVGDVKLKTANGSCVIRPVRKNCLQIE
jgi:hypothetical protein